MNFIKALFALGILFFRKCANFSSLNENEVTQLCSLSICLPQKKILDTEHNYKSSLLLFCPQASKRQTGEFSLLHRHLQRHIVKYGKENGSYPQGSQIQALPLNNLTQKYKYQKNYSTPGIFSKQL